MEEQTQDIQKAAEGFLERDFGQCFAQLRHYDSHIWDICKYAGTVYVGVLGATIGIFKFARDKQVDLTTPAVLVLLVAFSFGVVVLLFAVRNRVYFVRVARYVNEHRERFLKHHPFGFQNHSRMYTDPNLPSFHDAKSFHAWVIYLIAAANSIAISSAVYLTTLAYSYDRIASIIIFFITLIIQLLSAISYLRRHDNSPDTADH